MDKPRYDEFTKVNTKGENTIMKKPKNEVSQFYKEYLIKMKNTVIPFMRLTENMHYMESSTGNLNMKWINLPSDNEFTTLNKLMIENNTQTSVQLQLLIHYRVNSKRSIPFVYYSPNNEAIMVCNSSMYYLIGGLGPLGGPTQYQTNEIDLASSSTTDSNRSMYQPLSQESSAWGMVYDVLIEPNSIAHLYDWEIAHEQLYKLETIHEQYKELLGNKVPKRVKLLKRS